MCQCKAIPFQTYLNTVGMRPPTGSRMFTHLKHFGRQTENQYIVTIDSCIASEIAWLWHHEVITLNSCCGHNQATPWVIVHSRSVDQMKRLGYESQAMMLEDKSLRVTDVSACPRETFMLKGIWRIANDQNSNECRYGDTRHWTDGCNYSQKWKTVHGHVRYSTKPRHQKWKATRSKTEIYTRITN